METKRAKLWGLETFLTLVPFSLWVAITCITATAAWVHPSRVHMQMGPAIL
jgi:hypothetical protein